MKPQMKKPQYVVGIDPGTKTGYAVYNRETKSISEMATLDFWSVYKRVLEYFEPHGVIVMVEVPKHSRLHEYQDEKTGDRLREKIAGDVGGIAREARLLADGLELAGYQVRRVVPSRSKWTAKDLQQRTRITARTNEHVRDAISLCYGL